MKILLLADQAEPTLWEHLDRRKLEGVELVLACGDLPASYLSFLTCFTAAPILYIRGNHDDQYAQNPPEGCLCIEDQVVTVCGLRILGLGGSMRYNCGVNQYTEKQMRQRVQKLRFKIWRSGGMAEGFPWSQSIRYRANFLREEYADGLDPQDYVMEKYRPRYMVYGHVHQNYQYNFKRVRHHGDTTVINAFGYYLLDVPVTEHS